MSDSVGGYKHGRVPRAVREEQLLDIADDLFASKGYEATSIEQIARVAHVTRPIIYEHFGSKDGVYLACLRRARRQFEEAVVAAAGTSTDPVEQLERAADVYFAMLERDPERWWFVFGGNAAAHGPLGDELADLRFATVERIADLLRAHVPHADPQRVLAFAHAVSGAGEQLGRWWLRNREIPREQVLKHYRDFIWAGLAQLLGDRSGGSGAPARGLNAA
jgi:AcrR family transcriptional regulator